MAHVTAAASVTFAAGAGQPIPGLKGATAFVLIAVVVVIVAVVAVIPLIMDVRRATDWRREVTERLIDRAGTDPEVRDFLRDLREPRGVRGLTRSVIAALIIALVAFALAVAMLSSGGDSGDLRKTIVTSLMTVLATVAGFYFGSLGAQNSAEDARRHVKASAGARVTDTTDGTGATGSSASGAASGGTAAAGTGGTGTAAVAAAGEPGEGVTPATGDAAAEGA